MEHNSIELSNKPGVYTLVMACKYFGVENVIICPGSRNAPLTISFSRSGRFHCHSIADERVAAFYALGMALASGKPVAIVCTSGSAAANFSPALAEAFYRKIPIIAITADRPLAWTDQGNGQTIRQTDIYANFTVDAFSLDSAPQTHDDIWFNRRRLSTAFSKALVTHPGPIHINIPLAEPLYDTATYPVDITGFYKTTRAEHLISERKLKPLAQTFNTAQKVMILVGQMNPNTELESILRKYLKRDNVIVLTETTSNMHLAKAVDTIDRLLMALADEAVLKDLMPDLLISLGGYIVSKKLKARLREFRPKAHWHIDPSDSGLDTFQCLTDEIISDPKVFLESIEPHLSKTHSDYNSRWAALHKEAFKAHKSYISDLPYSDFYAFREILQNKTEPLNMHLANSSPVRYAQLFGTEVGINYFGNRGTSGIDGCTSTAAGFAKIDPKTPNLLITGDTAFMYDSNALWNRDFPKNLKIIVINNAGGGIFRIIEGPDSTQELEDYFEAFHRVDFKSIAKAHDIPFFKASSKEELRTTLPAFFAKAGPAILEIKTPAKANAGVLRNYFKHINTRL